MWNRCKRKGSFTVEATILIPLLIFILAGSIRAAVDMYQEERAKEDVMGGLWMVDKFYLERGIEEVISEGISGQGNRGGVR